ncbi:MAG: hypothetical protein ACOY4L_05325 [Pseudomonadota bacterium]
MLTTGSSAVVRISIAQLFLDHGQHGGFTVGGSFGVAVVPQDQRIGRHQYPLAALQLDQERRPGGAQGLRLRVHRAAPAMLVYDQDSRWLHGVLHLAGISAAHCAWKHRSEEVMSISSPWHARTSIRI